MRPHTLSTLALLALTLIPMPACDGETAAAEDDVIFECPDAAEDAEALELQHAPRMIPIAPPVDLEPRESVDGAEPAEAVTFREQGPWEGIYITKLGGNQIVRSLAAKLLLSPGNSQADPPQTCSITWYQPDTAKQERVLGWGCSMIAPQALWEAYLTIYKANGGVQYGG